MLHSERKFQQNFYEPQFCVLFRQKKKKIRSGWLGWHLSSFLFGKMGPELSTYPPVLFLFYVHWIEKRIHLKRSGQNMNDTGPFIVLILLLCNYIVQFLYLAITYNSLRFKKCSVMWGQKSCEDYWYAALKNSKKVISKRTKPEYFETAKWKTKKKNYIIYIIYNYIIHFILFGLLK